ncbi:putative ABC exporter domain-containing protein [Isobaculum melis]|uniref:Putative ABC exporter n=1 Tax=Isobaculum melis TaxID=142588 RepID=A0A1H9SCE9_9LACT|nr:putative ABC exporter domain-containing protein [Isobaculum melis]SER82657.1 Putative ABC exporter [Isobaculum melis]
MNNLIKLFFTKKKAKLRSIFTKPVSGIFTLLLVAGYVSMFIPVFDTAGKEPIDAMMASIYIMLVLAMALIVCLMTLLQKRQALFFEEDSYYLFIGPFTNRQILSYGVVDSLFLSFLTGLICVALPMLGVASMVVLPLSYILLGILISTLIVFLFTIMAQYIYLKDLVRETKSQTKKIIGFAFIVVIAGFLSYSYFTNGSDIKAGLMNFLLSKEFYYVPIIGWAKYALEGLITNDFLAILLGSGLLVALSVALSMLLVRIKGYFYEKAMIDAVEYSEFYKKAMSGEVVENEHKKHYEATIHYQKGEGAILSKSLLVLKKSRTIFTQQDLMSLVGVFIFGFFVLTNVLTYGGFVLLYLMNTSGTNTLIEELKMNYIYLIPGNPFKKLINTLIVPVVKTILLSMTMMAASYFMFDMKVMDWLAGMGIIVSFVFVFYAGNIVSIRMLKSRANKMLESALRMFVVLATCAPSAGLIWLIYHFTGNLMLNLAFLVPMLMGFNLLISFLLIYACSSMMNGNAYTAD